MARVTTRTKTKLALIGWREWVAVSELGGLTFRAKVDTGADTCALNASHIQVLGDTVSFRCGKKSYSLPLKELREIKSSNGSSGLRPVVELRTVLGSRERTHEFTLADRQAMRFPVLLGRNFLQGSYCVDVSQSYVFKKPSVS